MVRDRIVYIVIILCFLSGMVFAQDVTFTASVDRNKVTLNEQVELVLTVSGVQDVGEPELPKQDGFSVISRGSSSQFSFINGKMSASKSFTYMLMPLKEGTFTIQPAVISVDGKVLQTQPVTIEVVRGGNKIPQTPTASAQQNVQQAAPQPVPVTSVGVNDRVFIRVETDKNTAFIGEQITITFKFYHRSVMIDSLQYTPPVTKGFVTESMGQQKQYKDVLNGISYDVVELKTAVFPVTEGELTIEPAKLRCDLLVREQRKNRRPGGMPDDFFDDFFQDSFFGNYERYPIELVSDPIKITVNPVPSENKPDMFKGAVGTYDLTVEASPLSLAAGEPINLIMKISGAGNIAGVNEPVVRDTTGFKAYDSEIKTEITGREPQITGQKVFQKVIIPQNENIKEIPVVTFCYFDPITQKYKILTKGPLPITVSPAPKKETGIVELMKTSVPEEESKKTVRLLAKDIQYIEKYPGRFTKIGDEWYKNSLLWIIIVLAPLFILGFSFMYNIYMMRMHEDKVYARAKTAQKTAKYLLDEAIQYQKQDNAREFCDAIARALQKYVGDKLNIPAGAVTPLGLDVLLTPKGIAGDIVTRIKNLLGTCDLVRFGAHATNQSEMKQMTKEAEYIIKMLGKKL